MFSIRHPSENFFYYYSNDLTPVYTNKINLIERECKLQTRIKIKKVPNMVNIVKIAVIQEYIVVNYTVHLAGDVRAFSERSHASYNF